jgi:hypothetical protein
MSMSHQIALFTFTLGTGQSIGPAALQELWRRACESPDVSVGRREPGYRDDRPVYTLFAPTHLGDLAAVELRMRELLDRRGLRASFVATRT